MGKKSFIGLVSVAIIFAGILIAQDGARLYLDMAGSSGSYTYNIMFNSGLGMMLGAVGLGILLGSLAGNFMRRHSEANDPKSMVRGAGALLEDWGVSLSILGALILLVSGIFLGAFLSPRLVNTPEATGFIMNIQFFGNMTLLFGVCYLATRMLVSKNAWPISSVKDIFRGGQARGYLPSYRWAVLTLLIVVGVLVVKGAGLIAVHAFGWAEGIAIGTAIFHNIFALVAIVLLLVTIILVIAERLAIRAEVVSKPSEITA